MNPTGGPGAGDRRDRDVLTGATGGPPGPGIAPLPALRAAVYLQGLAGDLLAARLGEGGVLAGEIADALPEAWRLVRANPGR